MNELNEDDKVISEIDEEINLNLIEHKSEISVQNFMFDHSYVKHISTLKLCRLKKKLLKYI